MLEEQTVRIEALKLAADLTGMLSPEILHTQDIAEIWTGCRSLAETIALYIKGDLPDQAGQ
jgi:hypothetical protein